VNTLPGSAFCVAENVFECVFVSTTNMLLFILECHEFVNSLSKSPSPPCPVILAYIKPDVYRNIFYRVTFYNFKPTKFLSVQYIYHIIYIYVTYILLYVFIYINTNGKTRKAK